MGAQNSPTLSSSSRSVSAETNLVSPSQDLGWSMTKEGSLEVARGSPICSRLVNGIAYEFGEDLDHDESSGFGGAV